METIKLPISSEVYKNVDPIELLENNVSIIDAYIDEVGGINRRPCLSLFTDLGTGLPVDFLYWWDYRQVVIAISGGRTFKIQYPTSSPGTTDLTTSLLTAGIKPSIVAPTYSSDAWVFMSTGGNLIYTNGTTNTQALTVSGVPSAVSGLAYVDGYVLAAEAGSNRVWRSTTPPADPTGVWANGFFSASAHSDDATNLFALKGEIYVFGRQSVEVWENDGVTPFSRVPGGYIETGCIAPKSVAVTEDGIYWLDNKRHFVTFEGKGIRRVSSVYDRTIQLMGDVSDCTADRIEIGGRPFIAWHFKSGNLTLIYDFINNKWFQWGSYNSQTTEYNRWLGNSYCYAEPWNVHFVGSKTDGKIYAMSLEANSDEGVPVRAVLQTGHMSHGTLKNKRSHELRVRAKRGVVSSDNPSLMFRYRDNGRYWSQEKILSLGETGQTDMVLRHQRSGIYRTRQYELSCTDSVPLIFVDAEEDFEVLR